jgi:ribonuclease T1
VVFAWRLGLVRSLRRCAGRWGMGFLATVMVLGFQSLILSAHARDNPLSSVHAVSSLESMDRTVSLGKLPPQARKTHELILSGGPFPYSKDGTVFGNRERLLPRQARGTEAPGASSAAARNPVNLTTVFIPPIITRVFQESSPDRAIVFSLLFFSIFFFD